MFDTLIVWATTHPLTAFSSVIGALIVLSLLSSPAHGRTAAPTRIVNPIILALAVILAIVLVKRHRAEHGSDQPAWRDMLSMFA